MSQNVADCEITVAFCDANTRMAPPIPTGAPSFSNRARPKMDRAAGPGDTIVPDRAVGAGSGKPAAATQTGSRHGGDSEIVTHTGALKSVQVETPTAKPAGPERRIVVTSAADIYERPAADGTPLVGPHDQPHAARAQVGAASASASTVTIATVEFYCNASALKVGDMRVN